jgi:hypothetical protein
MQKKKLYCIFVKEHLSVCIKKHCFVYIKYLLQKYNDIQRLDFRNHIINLLPIFQCVFVRIKSKKRMAVAKLNIVCSLFCITI